MMVDDMWDTPGAGTLPSGLMAVRECMREMSGGNHIGKVIVCIPPAPPGPSVEAAVVVTGGLGTLGRLVAGWSVQQGSRRMTLLGRSGRTSEHPGGLLGASQACVVMARSDSSSAEEAAFAVHGTSATWGKAPAAGALFHAGGLLSVGRPWDTYHCTRHVIKKSCTQVIP